MSNYVWNSQLPYSEYLKAKSFISDVDSATHETCWRGSMDISRQILNVIASNELLQREHIELLTTSTDKAAGKRIDGFERVSYIINTGFEQVSSGISELKATFQWGCGAVLASIGHMNDTLPELLKISTTLAVHHFEIARIAFRQGFYQVSLEELDKAISSNNHYSICKLEWRVYQLKGILQLGFADSDISLYDLVKAEESFLISARYAKSGYSHDAGLAFLSAGWAAYCQGKMTEALAHTEQAMALYPALGEAFFQASKIQMALGEVDSALPLLAKAIRLDCFFALKAAGDGDFQQHDQRLREFIEVLRKETYNQSLLKVNAFLDKLKIFELASGAAECNELKPLYSFLSEGANLPLWDMLEAAQNLDSVKQLPVIVKIKVGEPIIKSGSFFTNAANENQQKSCTVLNGSTGSEVLFEFCPILAGTVRIGENTVKNNQDFYLGKYPVTQKQWEAVMGNNPSHFRGEILPVETISWDDVQTFIQKLNALSGKQLYRLPTQFEWEYACRAGSRSAYFFGDDEYRLDKYAWYSANSNETTHPVGQKKPNPWGLYDMPGNVWEWTDSFWDENTCSYRVICGGSWNFSSNECRSASRFSLTPKNRYFFIGFRLVFVP